MTSSTGSPSRSPCCHCSNPSAKCRCHPISGATPRAEDTDRYQTVYAKEPGAVAAPTAGLHFDDQMLIETRESGVRHAWVTLHVAAGTFQNLRREHIVANRLHKERVRVPAASCADAVRETRASGGRVIAVGTTTVRSLECASAGGAIEAFDGETDLFILPGYEFRSVDAMITNFHLPKSSPKRTGSPPSLTSSLRAMARARCYPDW